MASLIPRNRCELTLAEVAAATGGRLRGAADLKLTAVGTDSRAMGAGSLFVALAGLRFDGHVYLPAAAAAGAAAALVRRGVECALPRVEVDDTLYALGELARYHSRRLRARRPIPTIAIGGAVGKTTTKELTAALARALYHDVLATQGNLNNLIGVPLTLLQLTEAHRAMVIECGTNAPGEIRRLGEIVAPDVALVLNAEIEHTAGLGSLEGVAEEEAALFRAGARTAITRAEDRMLRARLPAGLHTLLFGAAAEADVRLLGRRLKPSRGRSSLLMSLRPELLADDSPRGHWEVPFELLGTSAALNATAAVAAVGALRPYAPGELALAAEALAAVQPVAGRLELKRMGAVRVLDDSYNASPSSLAAALEVAQELAGQAGSRLILALGDMLELGELSESAHEQAVAAALAAEPAALVAVGPAIGRAARALAHTTTLEMLQAADSEEAAALVAAMLQPGDLLLVKGSRGIQMERIVERLAAEGTA